jgi:hypothetical protein
MKDRSAVEATPHWFSMYSLLQGSLLDYRRDPAQGKGQLAKKDSRDRERAWLLCTL